MLAKLVHLDFTCWCFPCLHVFGDSLKRVADLESDGEEHPPLLPEALIPVLKNLGVTKRKCFLLSQLLCNKDVF